MRKDLEMAPHSVYQQKSFAMLDVYVNILLCKYMQVDSKQAV